jgi:CRISPR system Cascade subunit CasB
MSNDLIEFLRQHADDRGVMADLRGALVETKRRKSWPILSRFGAVGDDYRAKVVQYIAGWYALHPKETTDGNMGDTFRKLLGDDERKDFKSATAPGPVGKRFLHLLESEGDEIFDRISRIVMRAKSAEVPINYQQLYKDLSWWANNPDTIREHWAKHFWAHEAEENA